MIYFLTHLAVAPVTGFSESVIQYFIDQSPEILRRGSLSHSPC